MYIFTVFKLYIHIYSIFIISYCIFAGFWCFNVFLYCKPKHNSAFWLLRLIFNKPIIIIIIIIHYFKNRKVRGCSRLGFFSGQISTTHTLRKLHTYDQLITEHKINKDNSQISLRDFVLLGDPLKYGWSYGIVRPSLCVHLKSETRLEAKTSGTCDGL